MGRWDHQLRELEQATTVAWGGIGFANTVPPATQAYYELAEADDPGLRPSLERLVDKAKPAGRIYAAALLTALDPDAGRAAWSRLSKDSSEVSTFSGCIGGKTTVAQLASARLHPA